MPLLDPACKIILLNNNALSALTPADCAEFNVSPQAWKIDLKENALTDIAADCFSGTPGLKVLLLKNNALAAMDEDALSGLASLTYLDLGYNAFTEASLTPAHLDGVPNLLKLLLTSNQMGSLGALLQKVPALEVLQVRDNPLGSVPENLFENNRALQVLDLQKVLTPPAIFPDALFDGLPLTVLNLRENGLTTVPERLLQNVARSPAAPLDVPLALNPLVCCPDVLWLKDEQVAGSVVFHGGVTGTWGDPQPSCDDAAAQPFSAWDDFSAATCIRAYTLTPIGKRYFYVQPFRIPSDLFHLSHCGKKCVRALVRIVQVLNMFVGIRQG